MKPLLSARSILIRCLPPQSKGLAGAARADAVVSLNRRLFQVFGSVSRHQRQPSKAQSPFRLLRLLFLRRPAKKISTTLPNHPSFEQIAATHSISGDAV